MVLFNLWDENIYINYLCYRFFLSRILYFLYVVWEGFLEQIDFNWYFELYGKIQFGVQKKRFNLQVIEGIDINEKQVNFDDGWSEERVIVKLQ